MGRSTFASSPMRASTPKESCKRFMDKPRTARIDWGGHRGWLVVFPNNVAFAAQDDPNEYVQGLPGCWFPFCEGTFKGTIVEWFDSGEGDQGCAAGGDSPAHA